MCFCEGQNRRKRRVFVAACPSAPGRGRQSGSRVFPTISSLSFVIGNKARCSHKPCLLGANIPVRGDSENRSSHCLTGVESCSISSSTAAEHRQPIHILGR